jgi:hypothetical protein
MFWGSSASGQSGNIQQPREVALLKFPRMLTGAPGLVRGLVLRETFWSAQARIRR